MKPIYIVLIIGLYFALLFWISRITGKDDSNASFFKAKNSSPWYVVAFGMIGASLSGVTFVSVPGWVGTSQFSYMQVVLGYALGYIVISFVLLPLYYKLNLTSIYEYLLHRFGKKSHQTGALFFLLSRLVGSALRLFLVINVLQHFVFDEWNIPFEFSVLFTVLFIWLYTARAGIKTIVWTDALQTFFMLTALVLAVFFMLKELQWNLLDLFSAEEMKSYNQLFFTDSILERNYFWKAFVGGVLITVAMTGLDQDMMQKNLSIRNLKDAQKNMLSYGMTFVPINIVFLLLGALLFVYAHQTGMLIPEQTDLLFPEIALKTDLNAGLSIVFLLGLIAAAYSSADSGLTALTTSFCVDFLKIEDRPLDRQKGLRKKVHFGFGLVLIIIIIIANYFLTSNVIDLLLTAATYTYGPLLGLFTFGILSKRKVKDEWVIYLAVFAAGFTFVLGQLPKKYLGGYEFNYELLGINAMLMILGLFLISKK